MGDYDWIEPLVKTGVGVAGSLAANEAQQGAYQRVLDNLKQRYNAFQGVKPAGYQPITAEHLGPSALEGVQDDPQARVDEQASIAQLDQLIKGGGLTLGDLQALAQLESKLSRNATARNKAVTNQFAARGQLGAGAQLAAELDNAQSASEAANERGESTAANAQQRAMDAVLKKAGLSRSMSNDDYARKRAAAEAADEIARHNAAMATDASKYNNNLAGQSFDDEMKRLNDAYGMTGQQNETMVASGRQNANTAAGLAYGGAGLVGDLSRGSGKTDGGSVTGGGGASSSAGGTTDKPSSGWYDEPAGPEQQPDETAGLGDFPSGDDEEAAA